MNFRAPVAEPLQPFGTDVPVGTFVVTRPFGDMSFPQYGPHDGLDIGNGRTHDPVVAIEAGRVTYAGFDPNSGGAGIVRIDHGQGYGSGYAHLDRIDVSIGQNLIKGQPVGILGSTGWVTAAHLHFGITRNGVAVDPWPLLQGEDVKLPDGALAMARGVIGPGVGIRTSAIVAEDNLIRRVDADTFIDILFPLDGQGPYTDPVTQQQRRDWLAIAYGSDTACVARAYVRDIFTTDAGKTVLPLPVAGGFTQAQIDAARVEGVSIGFSRGKTKALAAVQGIEP